MLKFQTNSKALLACLLTVGKAVPTKSTITALYDFRFTLSGGSLSVTGSDMEQSLTCTLAVEGDAEEGTLCVPAGRLVNLLKTLPDVTLTVEGGKGGSEVVIRHTTGRFTIPANAGENYPDVLAGLREDAEERVSFTAPWEAVADALSYTAFAAGSDDLRPQMMGVNWRLEEGAAVLSATDTRILSRFRTTRIAPGKEGAFTLPSKAVGVVRSLAAKTGEVAITATSKSVTFEEAGRFCYSVQLVKGRYPDVDRVVPKDYSREARADRRAMLDAVSRVAVCASADNGFAKFTFDERGLVAKAQDPGFNSLGEESVACQCTSPITIGFNCGYIATLLGALPSQEVVFRMTEPSRPAVIMPAEQPEGGELRMLCMPVTLGPDA